MAQHRKLTPSLVRATRRTFNSPTYNSVATVVGVDAKTISNIVTGASYVGNPRSNQKLTMQEANTIRNWFAGNVSYNSVANFIGVDGKTVSNVVNGLTYREVR